MYENSIISDRDRLIRENIALVNRVVNYLKPRTPPHIDKDDMLQVGTLGLISAADSYNADLGIKFSDFARQRIKGAILDEVRKMSDISRLAIRNLQDHARAIQTLSSNLNRQPTNREIADFLNISLDEFESQRTHADRFKIESLEQGEELDIFDHFSSSSPNPLEEASQDELKMILIKEMGMLKEREQNILQLYYVEELNLREIGAIIGVNESRVSQILSKIAKDLKNKISESL
jgi:RNA polymerase sigma factor for flagellar operon FliA